jgi:aminopeptidase
MNTDRIRSLAELIVRFGANVQPGQIVALGSEPGKETLARAVAEVAYEQGAKYVDLAVFDLYLKRARALHAEPATLDFVPSWLGDRMLALGEQRCARIGLSGPVAPHALEGVDPALLGRDRLPYVREGGKVLNERTTNWTAAPCPTAGWAQLVFPDLEPEAALEQLWQEIAHICRLDEPDPIAAWKMRLGQLLTVAAKLDALDLESVRFEGPGTSLSVGLLPSSRWLCARVATVDGIEHVPNIPTEEVFTTPDPERVEGTVRSTKPLFVGGVLITGLEVRFEGGRAVQIDAEQSADTLRTLCQSDPAASRLGEVALVDRASRIGQLGTVYYDTLLDENAASHIALGQGLEFSIDDEEDIQRMNDSVIHIDFMIGSNDVTVAGTTKTGEVVALLRGGEWQI